MGHDQETSNLSEQSVDSFHTPAIIQRLINRDSEGKLAGGLIENAPEFLQHKEHNSPWWWTRKMLLEAGFHIIAFDPLPMTDVGYSNKRKRAIVVFYRAAPGVTPEITYLQKPKSK